MLKRNELEIDSIEVLWCEWQTVHKNCVRNHGFCKRASDCMYVCEWAHQVVNNLLELFCRIVGEIKKSKKQPEWTKKRMSYKHVVRNVRYGRMRHEKTGFVCCAGEC